MSCLLRFIPRIKGPKSKLIKFWYVNSSSPPKLIYSLDFSYNYSEAWISKLMHEFKHQFIINHFFSSVKNSCARLPPSGLSRLLLSCQLSSHCCQKRPSAKGWGKGGALNAQGLVGALQLDRLGFAFQRHCLAAMWPWTGCLSSMNVSRLTCKMEMVRAIS